MKIQVGDNVPDVRVHVFGEKAPEAVQTGELFAGKRSVIFALPGAFTPTCSRAHLPGYIEHAEQLHSHGVDLIACLSVNDAWVMDAWGKAHNAGDKVMMLADGNAEFSIAVGLQSDMKGAGFGVRSLRYAMVLDDGVVTHLNVEEPRKFEVSDAQTVLDLL
jgi:peroxiredoxin